MHIIYDIKNKIASELAGFGFWQLKLTAQPVNHRSSTPKFVTPTALSCLDNSWRSTTLSPPKKLTSSTANLEWCHVHFIRDSYSTFICRVIGPSKNSMELFCKAKFDFKSTWNRDSATSHHNAFTIWCCIPISRPPRVIRRFKRRSCSLMKRVFNLYMDQAYWGECHSPLFHHGNPCSV